MAKLQRFAMVNQAAHLLATPSRVTLSEIWYNLREDFYENLKNNSYCFVFAWSGNCCDGAVDQSKRNHDDSQHRQHGHRLRHASPGIRHYEFGNGIRYDGL